MAPIRVLLAEDNTLLRQGLARLIDSHADLDLVGAAEDLPTLMAQFEELGPDVVVTDIRMPPTGTDEGIRAAADARSQHPRSAWSCSASTRSRRTRSPFSTTDPRAGRYLLKERVSDVDELAARDPRGRRRRFGDRPQGGRGARRGHARSRPIAARAPHRRGSTRCSAEMAQGEVNAAIAGDARCCPSERSRSTSTRSSRSSGSVGGARREPAGQGRAAVPERSRLTRQRGVVAPLS